MEIKTKGKTSELLEEVHANADANDVNRASLRTLIGRKGLIGVEIGVSKGLNAYDMLTKLDISKLYLIDPYKKFQHFKQHKLDEHKQHAHELLDKDFSDKIIWIEDKSEIAASLIPSGLDFVYVDGNHSYKATTKDIVLYWPRIKVGGLICGDNLEVYDVAKAVSDFFINIGYFTDEVNEDDIDEENKGKLRVPLGDAVSFTANNDTDSLDWWVIKEPE